MNKTLRTLVLLAVSGASSAFGQTTVFSENMGTPSGTTVIASHTFQNSSLTFSGTGDVRNTSVSSGYTGSSGGGNVFLTNTVGRDFIISGIDTTGFVLGSLDISFGALKSTTASNLTELIVQYSINGTSYSALTFPAQPTGSGTAVWRRIIVDGAAIPSTTTLFLKWSQSSTGPSFRIDDIILTGTAIPEPSSAAALFGGLALAGVVGVRRRRRV
jgi:hypothetical protein